MRIISKFSDYYDCIQAYGMDREILYVRNQETIKNEGLRLPSCVVSRRSYQSWRNNDPFESMDWMVGFCGKVYPVLNIREKGETSEKGTFCFSMDDVDAYFAEHLDEERLEEYKSTKPNYKVSYTRKRKSYLDYFEEAAKVHESYEHVFREKKCPVFLVGDKVASRKGGEVYFHSQQNRCIILNACLKDVEFFRVFDPHTTYQEIFMYISGVLGGNMKEIPEMSDDDMRDSKGFDKWSFRKEPSSKKKKK